MTLKECTEIVRNYYIESMISECPDLSLEEAGALVPYDMYPVAHLYELTKFTPCRDHEKCKEGMVKAKYYMPVEVGAIEDACFILEETSTEWAGMFVKLITKEISKFVIVLNGEHVRYLSVDAIAHVILHESLHKDITENPIKYGWLEKPHFSGEERVISERLESFGYSMYLKESPVAYRMMIHRKDRDEIEKLPAEDAVMDLLACEHGQPLTPCRW